MNKILLIIFFWIIPLTVVEAQSKKVPKYHFSIFSSLESIIGFASVGLVVVVIGFVLYTWILGLFKNAGWYKDPLILELQDNLKKIADPLQATSLQAQSQTIMLSELQTKVETIQACLKNLSLQEILQSIEKDIHHEVSEVKAISKKIHMGDKESNDSFDKINGSLLPLNQKVVALEENTAKILRHIENQVFKEKQSDAFKQVTRIESLCGDIAKAVQTTPNLPMGQTTPSTYCQSNELEAQLQKDLRLVVDDIKKHHNQIEKEASITLGQVVLLLEQLVKKTDLMEHDLKKEKIRETE